MASIREKGVEVFDKGLITFVTKESLDPAAASLSNNFLTLGDRMETARGRRLLGSLSGVSTRVYNLFKGRAIDGTERFYRKISTKLQYWDPATESYVDVITGLPEEDMSGDTYRTPAGSFLFLSSPNSGLYRINMANPTSYVDLYDNTINYKGYIRINRNRMYLWGDVSRINKDEVGNNAVLRLSYIDSDWPYTAISGEALDTADGSSTYSGTFANALQAGRTVKIEHSQETFLDNGMGVLSGDNGGSGTVDYTTGEWEVTFGGTAPGSGAITGDYSYETPNDTGITDFRYSATRIAKQGTFLFQGDSSDEIVDVLVYDNVVYAFHGQSIWSVNPSDDDETFNNKLYRRNAGLAARGAAYATGDGIIFIDDTDEYPRFRALRYNAQGDVVEPQNMGEQLDLSQYDFTDGFVTSFGDYLMFVGRETGTTYNTTIFLYNTKWKVYDTMDGLYGSLQEYNGVLHGGSSVTEDVYKLFTGFSNDGNNLSAEYRGANWTLDTAKLKKVRRFVIEGYISVGQSLTIEIAYDNGQFVEIGTIAGDGSYAISSDHTQYGVTMYGSGVYGGGQDVVTANRYVKEFRISASPKFERAQIRIRTTGTGYASYQIWKYRDVRHSLKRVAKKFR